MSLVRVYFRASYDGFSAATTMNALYNDGHFAGVCAYGVWPHPERLVDGRLLMCSCARWCHLTDNGKREYAYQSFACACSGPNGGVLIDRIVDMAGTVLYAETEETWRSRYEPPTSEYPPTIDMKAGPVGRLP